MNISEWQQQAVADLAKIGTNPQLEVRLMLADVLGMNQSELITNSDLQISANQLVTLNAYLDQRVKERKPLAYILGTKGFLDFDVIVNESVLIPRPETERIVETVVEIVQKQNINTVYELGTGSGVISIAISRQCPGVKIVASDISQEALAIARQNVSEFDLGNKIELIQSDLGSHIDHADLIVANLPYLPEGLEVEKELTEEPQIALWSGIDGLDHYKRMMSITFNTAVIELGENQYQAFNDFLQSNYPEYKTTPIQGVDGTIVGMVITKD